MPLPRLRLDGGTVYLAMRPPFTVTIPHHVILSQNKTMRRHWAANKRDNDRCYYNIVSTRNKDQSGPHLGHRRRVHILSVRRRLITDKANLIGGAKGLIDALTRAGVIVDDRDEMVEITYEQKTGNKHTVITVEDMD